MCGTHPNPRASDLLDIRPVMSWLWGNETTEQAQFVVSALQGELDERESKIKALEAALKREQQDLTAVLEDEVKELEMRRQVLQKELDDVNALIVDKKELLLQSKTDGNKQKKNKEKEEKWYGKNGTRGL
uniref:Uncharacterized protein n=1 Tax=Peronospora matthiolae TaxID=2874970 RepID=A0AAV1UDZ4_9STRA